MKKIKTKNQATQILDELIETLEEVYPFVRKFERKKFAVAHQQLHLIQNSVEKSDDFFNSIFLNKTKDEVIEWIEKEAEDWDQ